MDVIFAIFIGVVSGIVASILISTVIRIFKFNILPWYQGVVYRGIDINGVWEGMYLSPSDHSIVGKICEEIFLEQNGHSVKGRMIVKVHPNGVKDHKEFSMEGVFKDNCLMLNCQGIDKTRFGFGSRVLKLAEDGRVLVGRHTYIGALSGDIFSTEEKWKRSK